MGFDRSHIDVEDYLECLEMRNVSKATEDEWRFSCPYPNHMNGDESASAYINDTTAAFFCHGCKQKGDGVTLAAYVMGVSHLEAVKMLRERYQPGYIDPNARSMREEVRKVLGADEPLPTFNVPFDESVLDSFDVAWEKVAKFPRFAPAAFRYMLERGFTPDTLNEWRFGYHAATDRITFPVRNEQGELIGIKGRAHDKERHPKYLVLGDVPGKPQRYGFTRYQTGLAVFALSAAIDFNENQQKPDEKAPSVCIVCEGELNAVALHQAGYHNAVAVNGSNFTMYQQHAIVRNFDHAIVFFDNDKAGLEGTWGYEDDGGQYHPGVVDKLKDYITVEVVHDHEGDPADMVMEGKLDYLSACIKGAKSATKLAIARAA